MYISYLPDEMIDDFEEGLRLGASWGLRHVEVRLVDGVNVLELTDEQVTRTRSLIEQYGMQVSALATPFFKCTIPGQESAADGPMHGATQASYQQHLDLLPRGVEIAQALGAPAMRIFSFWHDPAHQQAFWEIFPQAVDHALAATAGSGVIACLENEGACNIRTSADLAEAARRLPQQQLRLIFDPGNSTHAGLPPRREDFAQFSERIALVHLKDARYDQGTQKAEPMLFGAGETGYENVLSLLKQAGYRGALTLEPHFCPDEDCIAGMRKTVDALRSMAGELGIPL